MARSFGVVDQKVAESDFFLQKISKCKFNIFELRCYLSAFAASSRSITFALQSVLKGHDGFDLWYESHQTELKNNKLARFFHNFRTVSQHVGGDPYGGGRSTQNGSVLHYFLPTTDLREVPDDGIHTSCEKYLVLLIQIIFECYQKFGASIDAQQYFTADNFDELGKTIEDAEEELGFPRGWTDIGDPESLSYRWQALRNTTSGTEINHLFKKYLNKEILY